MGPHPDPNLQIIFDPSGSGCTTLNLVTVFSSSSCFFFFYHISPFYLFPFPVFPQMTSWIFPLSSCRGRWNFQDVRIGVFRIKCKGQNNFIWYTPERWRNNKYFRDSYFLSGSFWRQTASISRWSNHLRNRYSIQPKLWQVHIFVAAITMAPKLLADNMFGDKTLSISTHKLYHQSCWRWKNNQNDKKDRRRPGCCCHQRIASPVAKLSTQHMSQRLRLCPSWFPAQMVRIVILG